MYAGIDIGSRTIGLVGLSGGRMVVSEITSTGFEPVEAAHQLVRKEFKRVVATGYGRHAAKSNFAQGVITEIKAHALGARHLYPEARTVLDIGGQDTKVIQLNQDGKVTDFQMNDRCSAGTGKFLEIMATALGFGSIGEFGEAGLRGNPGLKISNMCTVFAESEAVTLLHRGADREDIALALHASVVERTAGMLQRVNYQPPLVFSGGVAHNRCIVALLTAKLGTEVLPAPDPQLVGALGAALAASSF